MSRFGITRNAAGASFMYVVASSGTVVAARVNACAATACAIPESHGALPPENGKSYSQPMPPPRWYTPRATSASASSCVPSTSPAVARAFSTPKFASG